MTYWFQSKMNALATVAHAFLQQLTVWLHRQGRVVQEWFPKEPLHSWTSDFAKAYRQVPLCPEQLHLSVVAQWHPVLGQDVFTIPYAQLFGGRTPPLHFDRHPAWLTFLFSAAIAVPNHWSRLRGQRAAQTPRRPKFHGAGLEMVGGRC